MVVVTTKKVTRDRTVRNSSLLFCIYLLAANLSAGAIDALLELKGNPPSVFGVSALVTSVKRIESKLAASKLHDAVAIVKKRNARMFAPLLRDLISAEALSPISLHETLMITTRLPYGLHATHTVSTRVPATLR